MYKVNCLIKRSPTVIQRPRLSNPRIHTYQHVHKTIKCKTGFVDTVEIVSYYVGKSIVLFTMMYCGLNYFHYRQQRQDSENDDDNAK